MVLEMNWRVKHFLIFILVLSMAASGFTSLLYAWGDAADASSSESDLEARAAREIQSVRDAAPAPEFVGEATVLSANTTVCEHTGPKGELVMSNCS